MIALISPTGSRSHQIQLLALFMSRQNYTGKVVWIIIDDCVPRTTDFIADNFKENWIIIKRYPTPIWRPGYNTQGRNISVGINTIFENYRDEEIEAIFIIEDDDYYHVNYLQQMMAKSTNYKVFAEINTIYYNVFFRRYFVNRNNSHASLFQIAFRTSMVPLFRTCYVERFIDYKFYEKLHAQGYVGRGEVGFLSENNLSIGMKGMPGRGGIGAGHGKAMNMSQDAEMRYLISLIGIEDAKFYDRFYGGSGYPQQKIFNRQNQ